MFIEQLNKDEKNLIDYLRRYGIESGEENNEFSDYSYVDCDYFLRYWESSKQSFMSDVFQNKLILKKKITITLENDNLFEEINDFIVETTLFTTFKKCIINMLERYNNMIEDVDTKTCYYNDTYSALENEVFSTSAILENRYNGPTIKLNLPNNTVFKLVKGCKIMKILNRLSKAANVESSFETIRITQSQIMNEAKISSNLCLSIHPLDYITASYNSCDWSSCMDWEEGDYRRGVIEMMNSPYVIVAYLESSSSDLRFKINGKKVFWNSKKWREFIIVSDEGIFGIKGYPYWNHKIENIALKWVSELFSTEKHSYSSKISMWNTDDGIVEDDSVKSSIRVRMNCGPAMYNDFYSNNVYYAILAKNVNGSMCLNYSGASECVICGEDDYFDSSNNLACECCVERHYCCSCEDEIYRLSDLFTFNDHEYCSYCYKHRIPKCDCCGKLLLYDVEGDNSVDPEDGVGFYIGDGKNPSSLLTCDSPWSPKLFTICLDCAKKVFVEGVNEINNPHETFEAYETFYGVAERSIIPIQRIAKIKKLNIPTNDIKKLFKKQALLYQG